MILFVFRGLAGSNPAGVALSSEQRRRAHHLPLGRWRSHEFDVEVAAIQAALPGARVSEVERHQSGDEFFFEVQLTHQGREHELDITDAGRILKDKLRPLR